MAFQELLDEERDVGNLKSCERCSHLNVCAVYRAVAPLLNSFEARKPFEAKELARICKEFELMVIVPQNTK